MAAQRHGAKIFLDLGDAPDDAANTLRPESACPPAGAGAPASTAMPAAVKTGPPAVRFPSTATTADSTQLGARPGSPGSPESASTMLLDLTASAAAAASDDTPPLYAPPDASEGPEAAEEYAAYLKRWAVGSTLHQRFQRLAAAGKLEGIREAWAEAEEHRFLDGLGATLERLRDEGGNGGRRGGTCKSRSRSRADMEAAAAAAAMGAGGGEGRQVRSRRAPATLSDFHVDAPGAAAGGSSDEAAGPDAKQQQLQQQQQRLAQLAQLARLAQPPAPPRPAAAAAALAAPVHARPPQHPHQHSAVLQMASQLGRALAGNPTAMADFLTELTRSRDPTAFVAHLTTAVHLKQQQQQQQQQQAQS